MKALLQGKNVADPVNEYASYVSVLLGASVLPQLIVSGMETVDSLILQNTRLCLIVPAKNPLPEYTSTFLGGGENGGKNLGPFGIYRYVETIRVL